MIDADVPPDFELDLPLDLDPLWFDPEHYTRLRVHAYDQAVRLARRREVVARLRRSTGSTATAKRCSPTPWTGSARPLSRPHRRSGRQPGLLATSPWP